MRALPKVFINCPYDDQYIVYFRLLIYLCYYFGCEPIFASEDHSAAPRGEKIVKLIQKSDYGIHDLSRVELSKDKGLPRFNMPFELGMYYMHVQEDSKSKPFLVLDREKNNYKADLSDLSGSDIVAYENNDAKFVKIIRDFFIGCFSYKEVLGPSKILAQYKNLFCTWLGDNLSNNEMDEAIEMGEFKQKVSLFFDAIQDIKLPS